MALTSLSELDQYKAAPFPPGYPEDTRSFYSPVDRVHDALEALLTSRTKESLWHVATRQQLTGPSVEVSDEKIM